MLAHDIPAICGAREEADEANTFVQYVCSRISTKFEVGRRVSVPGVNEQISNKYSHFVIMRVWGQGGRGAGRPINGSFRK